jgi:hypothetical protein
LVLIEYSEDEFVIPYNYGDVITGAPWQFITPNLRLRLHVESNIGIEAT